MSVVLVPRAQTGTAGGDEDRARLAELHDAMAALLASQGQWRQAYEHLRSAVELLSGSDVAQIPIQVPEQLRQEVDRLRRAHAEAREQSMRDSLTDRYNRRFLDQQLTDLAISMPGALAVALVDIDWFKRVNDSFGHLLGDRVLQRVADELSEGLPVEAFCARYGGEEFALVLPDLDHATAVAACEAARARVEHHPWHELASGLRVTVSIGLAYGRRSAVPEQPKPGQPPLGHHLPDLLLRSADELLYAAKQSGRNAVGFRPAADRTESRSTSSDEIALAGAAAARRAFISGSPAWSDPETYPP